MVVMFVFFTGWGLLEIMSLEPATLVWVEALDGGDPEKEAPYRDKLMTQSPPFTGEPKEIMKIKERYGGLSWLQQKGLALLSERYWKKRWRTTYLVNIDDPILILKYEPFSIGSGCCDRAPRIVVTVLRVHVDDFFRCLNCIRVIQFDLFDFFGNLIAPDTVLE